MGRKKGIPTCIIPIREKLNIKIEVKKYAKKTGMTIQAAYKKLIKEGMI